MLTHSKIYLDNNATTQVDPRVVDKILPLIKEEYGNPSSVHSFGRTARESLALSRDKVASYFQVKPQQIIFTSSATEALNMLLRGICETSLGHVITSNAEHPAVYSTIHHMVKKGCTATFLAPGLWGAVTKEAVEQAVRPDTCLIAIMAVNNETGVKSDIEGIAAVADRLRIPFVVDGVAWLGKEEIRLPRGVTAVCFSGHKIHAPKGVGCAVVSGNHKVVPLIIGGEQERGYRGGTENLPSIVGMAEAIALLESELPMALPRIYRLRDRLEGEICRRLSGVEVNGLGPRVGNTSNLAFSGVDGETLLTLLDLEGVAASLGSACTAGALEPSRVLLNMGISLSLARSSLRFSLSRFNTEEEVERVIEVVVALVNKLRC